MAANAIASLLMDRFVSASSADDARSSLERILEALEANKQPPLDDEKDEPPRLAPEMIWSDQDMLNALRQVLHTGNHKQNDMEVPVDEGASLVCKIYMEMVEQEANKSPLLDKDEALLECLIDVISSDPSNNDDPDAITVVSMYTRVLALQLLTKLCVKRPSKAQAQLLQAPNGLNRLGDLLQVHQEEIIRNEALLLAQVIAEWPSCAKIWMFAEVADQVILLAIEEGGLTGGNLLVQDCLDLLFRLWKHDPSLADLVFQSQTITQNLPLLLDLRQGTEFRNPPSKTKTAKKDDDLDDILKSAEDKAAESKEDEVVVPRLTGAEEKVISKTLDILSLLLESDGLKQSVWIRELQLCSFTWELALVAPPPPQVPFVCSVPSPTLQQKALETVALYFNDTTTLERHAGLDRLLYLVCTGGFGTSLMEKMGISQAALHVIRQTVSVESANQMLMYTLAPPMTMGDEDGGNTPPPPTVVHKLLNTVAENLTATEGIDPERRKVFLAGALGGLSVFLTDQTSREVMLRITTGTAESDEGDDPDDPAETTTTTSLVESILHAVGTMAETENPENPFLSTTLLRFLCHWTVETPAVVQTILSSNQSSIVLSALLGIKTKTQSHKKGVAVLGKLLLGLSMEYMGEDEGKCGGWTRASIMELIAKKSGGVSKFTSSLEQFKSVNDFGDTMPWSVCKLEFKVWSQWFANCVLLVRKRVVQELTGSGDGEEEDEEDEGLEGSIPRDTAGSGSARSLQKVVFQQSKEIDELQQSLDTANATIKTQHHDLSEYKRRVESAPSQLDTMLNEYLAKIAELENTVSSLHEKNRLDKEKHTSESKARDDRIALLEKELEESRAREKESRDEADTVREDMESLSQAYTNLEQEYRHQQQQQQGRQESGVSSTETTTTVSEQQPGEPDQEGAAGGHAGSTEISALRAENERLRNDAQAADKWMSMAVEKMQAMGQQNAGLQAELSTLKDGQAMNQQHLELQQHNQTLFAEKEAIVRQQSQMQAHLDGVVNENQGLRGALNQGQAQYMELERQLTGAREELQSTVTALEEARSQGAAERADLDNQLTELRSELESLSSERARLQEQLDEIQKKSAEGEVQAQASAQAVATYEAALTSKDEEIMKLQNAMAGQSSSVEAQKESHAQEVEALQKSIAELQGQIEASNTEVERIRTNGQEEIYKCESRIRELEAKQTTGLGAQSAASDEALKKKDGEISELTAANDAAQEWMARAVDHHNMLSQQHAKLGTENAALLAQIKELKEKVAQDSATISKAKALEEESLAKANRIRDSEASLEACKLELQRVQAEVTLLQNQKLELASSAAEVQQLQNQLDNLRASHDEQVAACESARQELVLEKESKEEALAKLEAANKEHSDSRVNAEDEIRTLKERMEALDAALKDKSATFDELNAQIAAERESSKSANDKRESLRMETEQLSEELELLRSKSETAEEDTQKVIDLTKELEIAKGTNESLLRSQEDDKMTISRLSDEIASMRSAKETLTVQQTPPAAATETPAAEAFFSVAPQSQPVAAHDVFSAGGSAAAASESLAPPQPGNPSGALQLFASGPPASEGVSARDVFGSAPSEQSAGDFFSGGPRVSDTAASTNAEGLQRTADLERQLQQSSEQVRQLEQQLREARAELEQTKTQVAEKGTGGPERISELELAVNQLQQQLKESEDAKTQQVLMVESLEKKSSELSLLVESSGAQGNVQKELEETTERVAGLESAIKDMEIQLTEQEENATTVIAKWQESCNALEEKNAELLSALESCGVGEEGVISREALALLHERLRETEASLASARAHMKDDDDVVLRWQERVAELEAAGKEFDSQLSQQELEAKTAIAQWQESCTSLQEQNTELLSKHEQMQQELNEAKARILEDEDVVAKWQDRTSALEEAIKDLEAQLNEQEEDANNVISMWQQSCSTLEEQKAELAQNLETSNEAETNIRAQLQESQQALEESQQNVTKGEEALAQSVEAEKNLKAQFEETQQALEENKEKVLKGEEDLAKHMEASLETEKSLRADLEEIKQAFEESSEQASLAEAALSDSRAECGKLAYKASDLEKRLTESEEESKAAIETLQEKCTSLEGGKSEVFQQLETTKDNIEKLQAQLQQQQESEEESKAAIETLQEKCTSLEAEKSEVVRQVETTKDNIAKLQAQLQQQQESLKDDETAVSQWQVRATELEAVVKELEDQLAEQEEEAQNVIAMWQESCTKIGDEKSELEQRLESSEASVASVSGELQATKQLLDEANNKLQDKEEEIRTQQGRVAELESNLEEMRSKLAQQQEQAKAEIEKWQESISSLEDLKEEKLKEDEDVVLQWQERATELEAVVKDLETQLNEQEEEANNVIAMWQESCNTLEATNQELAQSSEKLEEQLESSKAAASSAAELLKTTEVDKKELQERVNELETASRGLEAKLSDEDEKAKSLIADWQEKVASLQAAKDEVTVALTTAKDNQQSMEQELASLQSQMKETEGELTVARESLSEKEAMVASLEGRLQAMIESQDLDASEKDRELDSLRGQVSTLQLELDKTEASLKEAQANLAHNEKAVSEWEKRANEFETSVKELEEQLTEQENEARNAISDWSDRVQLLEKEKGDLAQSLAAALNRSKELTDENKSSASSASQLADAKAALEEKQLVVEDLNEQVAELESMVNGLQQRLFVNEKEVSDKKEQVAELESMVNGLQQRLFLTEKEASARREELEESASQVAMFESMVNGLQHQLLTSEKDSTAKRDQLQESITNYKRQAEDLDRELQEARAKIEQLEATDTAKPSEDKVEARPSEALADELEDVSLSHDDELPSPTGQTEGGADPKDDGEVAELKSLVQELEEQIKAKDSEMAGEVREWQGHCVALETQINDLSKELEKVSKALARAREDRSNDPDYEGSVEQQIAELESTIESLEQELEDKHIEAENAIAEWQDSYGVLGAKNGELEEQLAALNIQVQDLRDTKQAVDAELDQYKSLQTQASEEAGKLKAELEAASDADASEKPAADGEAALELKSKIANLEATLAEREQELSDRPKESALQELEARCAAQGEKISLLNTHLEETIKDRDEAVAKLKSAEKLSSATADFSQESERLTEKIAELETLVEDLKKERDTSVAAMEESSRQLVQKSEEDEAAVAQWNERIKQLESELERQETEANEAIAGWESSYSMVQESLTGAQAELETCKAELVDLLKAQVSSLDEILVKYDDEYAADELSNDLSDVDALRTKCRERLNLIETFVSSQDGDIKTLFIEMESLRTQIQEMEGDVQAGASVELLRSQLADANKKTAEKQSSLEELKRSLASEQGKTTQLKSASTELETKVTALEASVEAEIAAKEALEAKAFELESVITKEQLLKGELEAKLASLEGAVKDEQLANGLLQEELQAKVSELESALNKEQLAKGGLEGELEAKVGALESAVKDEQLAKASLERELQARVSELESTVNKEQQSKGVLQGALEAKVASMESLQGELFNLKEKLEHVSVRESQVTAELEKAAAEGIQLRESLSAKTNTDSSESETNKQELSILKSEKSALENEVQRLSKISEVLEYDLQEANNAMQVYITKEVSDEAKAYATQVLREQLNEIRKKADADRAAVAAEKEAKMALEAEVERLRADLYALVDVTDQENEMYGKHALTIKATDKIHRKERNEINELRKSLSRALEELRTSRTAERDAEERAAKAAHHVVVCEQELVAAKSDMRYLIQTMDEMRQDEASRRASLEHRIMTLENDHEVLQRFHATETDSLRNELTQAVMEKDRTLQLLKDAEKNNAAMLYAASRDHSARADESSETELAKLRIEKAQLLVAAAEEGARTERRIREVIATELSSAETDILVEREKRLAAEAAYDNMKLLVAELQNDVQAYRQESRLGRSPGKMMVEADNNRLKDELERALQEISSLRSQLIAAQSAVESANYRIERLTADLHVQQASSNRLGREMKFQTEFQQEMLRMRSTPQAVRENDDGEEKKEKREDEILTIVELYDKIHEQAEAQKQARECYLELKSAHEDLLSLLAQTEEQRQHLERALVEARGQAAVDAVNEKSDQSVIAQYGQRVRVKTP